MKKINETIHKNSTGKKVLVLFIITTIVYAVMLIITIPKTMIYSNGMRLLDMMPGGYDSEYIRTLFEALGEKGRRIYLLNQIPIDMIYPFLFGITYCLLMAYLLKKIDKFNSALYYLCFLPVIAGIADYLENLGVISMLVNYPGQSHFSMMATNVFTLIKSTMTTLYFVALIIVLLMLGIKTIKTRNPQDRLFGI